MIKHGEFRHFLSRRATLPPVPVQWVISSGRPDAGSDDQEYLMNTQDIVETWRREAIHEGERKLLLRLLRRRFGTQVDAEAELRVAAAPAAQIDVWAERVLSAATLPEILAD
ncbi:MAG: DUF4351 domain-containing protein [Kofleriaceae bacterium]